MEDEIKEFLKNNPNFFEKNASLLADIHLPSPYGKGTISLAERQQLAQRDKIRVLESKFTELVLNAEENEVIANKIHHLTLGMLSAPDFNAMHDHITDCLRDQFNLPDAQLKLWSTSDIKHGAFINVDDSIKNWVQDLSQPYCGEMPTVDIADWFSEAPESLAIVPLKGEDISGALILPSSKKGHFYASMGTLFLSRIGELVNASLANHIS